MRGGHANPTASQSQGFDPLAFATNAVRGKMKSYYQPSQGSIPSTPVSHPEPEPIPTSPRQSSVHQSANTDSSQSATNATTGKEMISIEAAIDHIMNSNGRIDPDLHESSPKVSPQVSSSPSSGYYSTAAAASVNQTSSITRTPLLPSSSECLDPLG